jgi:hypothetical protein
MSGACCIAAAVTVVVLIWRGCDAWVTGGRTRLAMEVPHWWVETWDGWILDPTFGQFSWGIVPFAAHVLSRESRDLVPYKKHTIEEFMALTGHPTLPSENMAVVDRLLVRMTGAPYARC